MPAQDPTTHRGEFRRLWRDWVSVIEKFARQSPARHAVDSVCFQQLYRELLRNQSSDSAVGNLVRPWVSPEALEHTPRKILLDLLAKCRQVEQELSSRRWLTRFRLGSRGVVLFLVTAVVGALVGAASLGGTTTTELIEEIRRPFGRFVLNLKPIEWVAVIGIGMSLVMGFLLARPARI